MPIPALSDGGPGRGLAAIVPADGTRIGPFRALYVGGSGNAAVRDGNGNVTLLSGLVAGTVIPIMVTGVESTLTTATLLVGLQ